MAMTKRDIGRNFYIAFLLEYEIKIYKSDVVYDSEDCSGVISSTPITEKIYKKV